MNGIIRTLIADDERSARSNLRRMLQKHAGAITVVGEASDGREAVDAIRTLAPDLVFMDIHMPVMDGFEVVSRAQPPLPIIVFTTAYDNYALKAFEVNSIDYLLKPFSADRLDRTITRILNYPRATGTDLAAIRLTLDSLAQGDEKRLAVKTGNTMLFLDLADICCFQGEDYLTGVYTSTQKYLIEKPLYELESLLPAGKFIRIHRSTIVNIRHVQEIRKTGLGGCRVVLRPPCSRELPISRSYNQRIKELFHCI